MNISTIQSDWFGHVAYELQSNDFRIICVPSLGGKLVSIFDKKKRFEWLEQPVNPPHNQIPYGADFITYSMFGWDEMFPTIDICTYPIKGPYFGNQMPEHGDAWTLNWEIVQHKDNFLKMSTFGKSLPYQFEKELFFKTDDTITMHYQVTNIGTEGFYYLWSAHPLFLCKSGMKIILPQDVSELINVKQTGKWGEIGNKFNWPTTRALEGFTWQLDQVGPPTLHDFRKFYISPKKTIYWASLFYPEAGNWIRMNWDAKKLPYFGLWIDEGYYTAQSLIAFEPTTSYFDALDRAICNQKTPFLEKGERFTWDIELTIGS